MRTHPLDVVHSHVETVRFGVGNCGPLHRPLDGISELLRDIDAVLP